MAVDGSSCEGRGAAAQERFTTARSVASTEGTTKTTTGSCPAAREHVRR